MTAMHITRTSSAAAATIVAMNHGSRVRGRACDLGGFGDGDGGDGDGDGDDTISVALALPGPKGPDAACVAVSVVVPAV